jgi:hypothetical protein
MNSLFVIEWFADRTYQQEYFKTAEAAFARFIVLDDRGVGPTITQHTLQD